MAAATLLVTGCSSGGDTSMVGTASEAEPSPDASAEGVGSKANPAGEQLAVVPATTGDDGTTPTAVATPAANGSTAQDKPGLKVASYNADTGRAVIAAVTRKGDGEKSGDKAGTPAEGAEDTAPTTDATEAPAGPDGTEPAATPDADAAEAPATEAPATEAPADDSDSDRDSGDTDAGDTAEDTDTVSVGDIIASAPAPGAPNGLLAEVTEVIGTTYAGTEVATAPSTLNALLGDATAEGSVPVDPSTVEVKPLVEGVKVSWAKSAGLTFGPKSAKLPFGSLRIDVGAAVATAQGAPASAAASVNGFVQLAPEVEFSYNGSGSKSAPGSASLALAGDWASQWSLKGQAAAKTQGGKPLRIPFAELHTNPVIQVGVVPIVVNLDVTAYFQVDGDGRIEVDVQQDLKGDFKVGGSFSLFKGWKPISESNMSGEPLRASVATAGKVKASLGVEAAVGLYGTVGVVGDVAPFLRAEAEAVATGSADSTGAASGAWKLHGGIDLNGSLRLQLTIFGTPLFKKDIPLVAVNKEWLLTEGRGSVNTPVKAAS
ncbi:hypothetical protein [Streptomyces paludis]|uniref:Uncharacterized protein n=1 Tax=Streptomyces paludis TaxID=2282738 RepID=A0A345HTB9_9ACTN|nr:hypothetical protein [Streptomyces paludis]AXG79943.1 hypothetical protein DVK44_22380 [Streptomyces paludis]